MADGWPITSAAAAAAAVLLLVFAVAAVDGESPWEPLPFEWTHLPAGRKLLSVSPFFFEKSGISTTALYLQAAVFLAIRTGRCLRAPLVNRDQYLLWADTHGRSVATMVPITHYYDWAHLTDSLAAAGYALCTTEAAAHGAGESDGVFVFLNTLAAIAALPANPAAHVHARTMPMSGFYRSDADRALRRAIVRGMIEAPRLAAVASRLALALGRRYNAVYTRTEDDWARVCAAFDIREGCLVSADEAAAALRRLALADEPLPLLLLGASSRNASVVSAFTTRGFAVVSKESVWPEIRREHGAHELALIEAALAAGAQRFVGNALSSFSFLVAEARAIAGQYSAVYNGERYGCDGAGPLCGLSERLYVSGCLADSSLRECWREAMARRWDSAATSEP
eukprot:c12733_g1_i1.p1 GENE.c12733_g1_i1~~c12733_g1_i1.p1  ORF type:complete len:396 (+),score=48.71 c12733_g1_i1:944-2131(+)